MSYPHLTQVFELGGRRLPNRIVLPPLVLRRATEDGLVTPAVLDQYAACAGPGMVIVEATVVSPEGRLAREQLGAFDDSQITGLAALASRIHETGALASIQIHHAGRNTNTGNTFGRPLVAPSALPARASAPPQDVPQVLDESGIRRIIDCFAAAAVRAARAGFDAVEVHAAHGYLVSQFLSPLANHRTDGWGGSLENRSRFLREIVGAIRCAAGTALLVSCRLGVADGGPGGLTLEEGIEVARRLEKDGMPFVHVSTGIGDPPRLSTQGGVWSDRLLLGAAVKRAVGIPVVGVGGLTTPELADRALAEGLADLAAVGRGMLADPAWTRKTLQGRADTIRLCRSCRVCHHFGHGERCPARREQPARS